MPWTQLADSGLCGRPRLRVGVWVSPGGQVQERAYAWARATVHEGMTTHECVTTHEGATMHEEVTMYEEATHRYRDEGLGCPSSVERRTRLKIVAKVMKE